MSISPAPFRSVHRERTSFYLCYFDRLIFGALLALIALVALPYGTVEAWWVAVFECAVFTLGALWIIEGMLSGTWHVRERRLLAPLLCLVVFAFLQTLPLLREATGAIGSEAELPRAVSAAPYETRSFTRKLLALILCGLLFLRYTSNERRLRALIYVVIGIGVASALFGILRQTMHHGEPGFVLPSLQPGTGYGQFINRDHFALLMEITLGLALGLVVGGGVRRERLLIYGAAALPVWLALVLTYSRGGIFGMLSQLLFLIVVFGLMRPKQSHREEEGETPAWLRRIFGVFAMRTALVVCLMIAASISIVWIGGDFLVTRMEALPGQANMVSSKIGGEISRMEIWLATWQLIKAHPVLGSGFGAYGVAITKHHDSSGEWTPGAAHNDYLELLAAGGIVGVALVAWFAIAFMQSVRARLRSADRFRRAACCGALTALFGVVVHSFVDFGLHITVNALVSTVLVVVATAETSTKPSITKQQEADARARRFVISDEERFVKAN